jgi:hypothetical protein
LPTSAPGLRPHLRRDCDHICAETAPTSAPRLRPHLRRDCAQICVKQHELRTERCKPAGGPPRVPPECSAHRKQRHESIGAALNDGLHLRTSAPCGAWESNAHSSARYASACMCAHSRDRVTRAHKPREHAHAPVVRRCAGRASGGPKARVHAYAHACARVHAARACACVRLCVRLGPAMLTMLASPRA